MPKGYRSGGGSHNEYNPNSAMVAIRTETATKKLMNDKQFELLANRMKRQYGIDLHASLRDNQDWKGIRDNIYGIESVLKEFPEAQQYIEGIQVQSSGRKLGVLADANLSSLEISLNDSWFRDYRNLDTFMKHDRSSPKGSTGQSVATHETGHLLVTALARKYNQSYDNVAKSVTKNALKSPVVQRQLSNDKKPYHAKWYMAGKISSYAATNNHELIAEAVADYMSNKSKASTYSRAIVQEIKKQLRS